MPNWDGERERVVSLNQAGPGPGNWIGRGRGYRPGPGHRLRRVQACAIPNSQEPENNVSPTPVMPSLILVMPDLIQVMPSLPPATPGI